MSLLRLFLLLPIALFLTGASKAPLARDGHRDGFVVDGKQNYPFKLYGVAIKWDRDCKSGKADMCMRLGDAFVAGEGDLRIDLRAAIGYYLLACDKGRALGCSTAAAMVREGRAYAPIPELAYRTAEKGCALKDGDSCAAVALHIYRGDAVAADKPRAKAMWDAGCAAARDDNCRLKAGALFYESDDAADQAAAIALYRTACAAKQGWGCSGLADAYARGRGIAKDDAQAAATARTGCLGASGDIVLACAIHARYLSMTGNPADAKKASGMLTNACLAKVGEACNDAGLMAKRNPPGSGFATWEVARSFRDGCDLDYGPACGNLGELYAGGFDKIDRDSAYAVALYDKGCRLGDAASCRRAQAMGSAADAARARKPAIDPAAPARVQLAQAAEFAKKGRGDDAYLAVGRLMEEAVDAAEWMFGGWLYYGQPGVVDTPNKRDGAILFENAARQGHVEALKWAGMAYWYGDGVTQNRDKALGYMRAAALRNDQMAENIYRSMLAEPIRQDYIRREREMAEAAERQRNSWSSAFSAALSAWAAQPYRPLSSGFSSSSSSAASSSWQNYQNRADQTNFNNYIKYMSGGTTACISSNPYCR
ncbi:MAG TPA: hypothetical protein PKD99_16425 [Sphingopyxis sp.]|nr:hypothetical protein [Sphingopyxis sp.]HMP46687.1 hypothetical protein [Sphingopyxis sp.]HMQ20623.1 hypothetical protein [Sphingopyxis sp.]